MKKTVELFKKILKQSLMPLSDQTVSEWADSYRMISGEAAAEPGRWRTDRAPYQKAIMDAFTEPGITRVVAKTASQVGKALDIKTPIVTTEGWKCIGDLVAGDTVFDENGNQCKVLWKSATMENHDCYELEFSDGAKIVADAEHKWYVEPFNREPCVLTTQELLKDYSVGDRNIYAIPVAKPIKSSVKNLLIHPYLLGAWLGDGNSCSAQITIHEQDIEIAEYIKEQGYNVVVRDKCADGHIKNIQIDPLQRNNICQRGHNTDITGLTKRGYCAECHRQISLRNKWAGVKTVSVDPVINTPNTLRAKLEKLNLIGNKHIPQEYLRASVDQRFELLKGLMDTDGSINKKGRCEITFKSKTLILGLSELLSSLGIKHTVKERTALCYNSPTKAASQVWRVSFLVYSDTPVFKLRRHLARQKSREGCRVSETERRRILRIEKVDSRPVCCIAVDSPNHLYLAGKAMIPTHNSDIMNNVIGRFAHLAPAPIMMIQPTIETSQDYSKSRIAPMIRDTKVLRDIFKDVKSRDAGNTILSKQFPGGRLIMAGANSPAGLASKPIKILLADEVDRFPKSAGTEGDPVSLTAKRMTTFWDRVMGLFSTPTNAGDSRIEDEYITGTQEEWQHQCPKCKEWHLVTHRDMHTDYDCSVDKKGTRQFIVKSVIWRCSDCGFGFTETEMRQAAQKYIAQNASALTKGVRSFFVNCFASPWVNWSDVMQEWLEAQGDPEREKVVVNTRFGEAYERKGNFESHEQFVRRRENYGAELPEGVLLLTAAVDVQDNRLEYEICGWGMAEECWGIKKGTILGVPDTPKVWDMLDEQLDKEYRFASGKGLLVARTFIDSGGHYTKEVYAYCKKRFARQRFAIKGSSTPGVPLLHKYAKVKTVRGHTIPLVMLGTDSGKQYVMDRLSIEEPGPKYFHFPLDKSDSVTVQLTRGYDEFYFKGLISETKEPRRKNGVLVYQWVNIAKDKRNEPLDLRVYNLACMLSVNPDFEALEKLINSPNVIKEQSVKSKLKNKPKGGYGCIRKGVRGDY